MLTYLQIILAGDSAGGHMALSLISHLLHPHSDVSKVELSEPLAGVILVSPWVKFATDDDSVKRNMTSDYVTAAAATRWSNAYLGRCYRPQAMRG
jgi:acetyl esterase/lipase